MANVEDESGGSLIGCMLALVLFIGSCGLLGIAVKFARWAWQGAL